MSKEKCLEVVNILNKNRFHARYFETINDVIEELLNTIALEQTVGMGGSKTLIDNHIYEKLAERGNIVYDHHLPNQTPEEKLQIRKNQLLCDVFLTSSNAITEDGKLVNTDGTGQRVAAMIFGPKKVIVIAGINKIVRNVDEALKRMKEIAAPQNSKRVKNNNPCVHTGYCMDCDSQTRICNATTILNKQPNDSNIHVWLVNENLGF